MRELEEDKARLERETEAKEDKLESLLKRFGEEVERVEQIQKEISPIHSTETTKWENYRNHPIYPISPELSQFQRMKGPTISGCSR